MSTRRPTMTPPLRRLTTMGTAAVAGLALAVGTIATPAHAADPVPTTDAEAERLNDERAAEDPAELDRSSVPAGVSVEQARSVVESSDEITVADVEYAAAVEDLPASGVPADFYETPATLPEENGAVVRQAESDFYLDPVRLIRHNAKTTTFMYRTTDERGTARAATATLLSPANSEGPAQDAVVIAPGTQGTADKCAPSRQLSMGTEYEGIGVTSALAADRPVIVVDYIGLGTEGPHRYLNRVEEGRAVLDAARAVQQVEGSGIDAETQLQLRGYSQGGQATAAALELAAEWAPELNLTSASAGAAPTDLNDAVGSLSGVYTGFLLFGADSFAEQASIDLSEHLNEQGQETVERAAGQCTVEAVLTNAFVDTSTLTKNGGDFQQLVEEEFTAVLDEQRLGTAAIPDIPVLVNHSRLDDVVPFAQGRGLAAAWCDAGRSVTFADNLAPTHIGGYLASLPRVEAFTSTTFAGRSPLNSCWRL